MNDERRGCPSASGMARYKACPGSFALEKTCPDIKSEDAELGTIGHAVLAGEKPIDALDDKMRETVETALRLKDELLKHHGFDTGAAYSKEERIWALIGEWKVSGKPDFIAFKEETIDVLIIDYKLLHGDHDAADTNLQLRALAAIAFNTFPTERVICALIQPWAKGQVTVAEYDRSALIASTIEIEEILAGVNNPLAKRHPGPHCKYCRAAGICPEATTQTQVKVEKLKQDARSLDSYTPDERGQMLQWIEYAEDLLDARKKELHRMVKEQPGSVTGYTIKPGNEVRKLEDSAQLYHALKAAVEMYGSQRAVFINDFLKICKVGVGDAEKFFKAQTGLKGKDFEQAFELAIASCVTTNKNKDSVERIK